MSQAGYKTEQQINAIGATLNLASAGALELADSTRITLNVLGSFQLGVQSASHATDVPAQAGDEDTQSFWLWPANTEYTRLNLNWKAPFILIGNGL
ncbi:MAG: hypothetical protein AAFY67_15435 [Cyanobacteria bacterium J06642_9]